MSRKRDSWVLLAGLMACGDAAKDDTGSAGTDDTADGGDGSDDGGSDGGGSGTSTSDIPPVVSGADAWCYQHTTGEERWIWRVEATVDDPQGLDTVMSYVADGVIVSQGGAEVVRYPLACDLATGACSTQFEQSQDNVLCSSASSYTFAVVAVDEDDNRSDPATATGRQGSGPGGR